MLVQYDYTPAFSVGGGKTKQEEDHDLSKVKQQREEQGLRANTLTEDKPKTFVRVQGESDTDNSSGSNDGVIRPEEQGEHNGNIPVRKGSPPVGPKVSKPEGESTTTVVEQDGDFEYDSSGNRVTAGNKPEDNDSTPTVVVLEDTRDEEYYKIRARDLI